MPRERYDPHDNQWNPYPEADWDAFFQAVHADIGTKMKLSVTSDGMVVLDTDDIPPGVTENQVKQAIRDNHPFRQ